MNSLLQFIGDDGKDQQTQDSWVWRLAPLLLLFPVGIFILPDFLMRKFGAAGNQNRWILLIAFEIVVLGFVLISRRKLHRRIPWVRIALCLMGLMFLSLAAACMYILALGRPDTADANMLTFIFGFFFACASFGSFHSAFARE